jgi:4-amino-4-deoxy-L-arabinose transferase-like glycosyltransferase
VDHYLLNGVRLGPLATLPERADRLGAHAPARARLQPPAAGSDESGPAYSDQGREWKLGASSVLSFIRTNMKWTLFAMILLTGVFARTWEFGSLPPGLSQDEATNGVDAYSILRFGVDRNGVSFPVEFIAWGSGVSALYGYILVPFIALGGLSPLTVRTPLLVSGILSLPLMFWVGTRLAGREFGLLAMFLLAISPWHILASRWGLEANLLPFLFLAAFACLLKSTRTNNWFVVGCILLAACLYSYGPAYAAVPVFLSVAVPIMLITRRVGLQSLLIGLAAFTLIAIPIGIFLYINTFKMDAISFGPLTVPRLPGEPRFEGQAALFGDEVVLSLKLNARRLLLLLWNQTDGQPWNTVDPYGYFYRYSFPLAVAGTVLLIPLRRIRESPERLLVLGWMGAGLVLGLLQPASINRTNLVFFPLLIATGFFLEWLRRHSRPAFVLAIIALLAGFVLFTRDYHSAQERERLGGPYFAGLLEALDYARNVTDNPICVTDEVRMPYIFVLFVEKMNPADYLSTIEYDDPNGAFRKPRHLGRYSLGQRNCTNHSDGTVYVLDQTESIPFAELYRTEKFGNFVVYVP